MSTFSSGTQRQASRVYEQEVSLNHIFDDLSEGFKKLDSMNDSKKQSELKRMTGLMQEAKSLIRDFEREAKIDNMSVDELNYRKKLLQRKELMDSKSPVAAGPSADEIREMSTNDMIELGRKNIQETDESLLRSERVVNDTIAIGAQTAETLQTQGNQLNKISNDLDEIHFSMKKARQVIRDLARRLATDRCIMFVLLLVIIGIVVIVVLKITGVGDVNV
eukprot:jgi/Picre1/30340/NNA_005704.t1